MASKISPQRAYAMQGSHTSPTPDGTARGGSRSPDTLSPSDAAAICAGNLQEKCYLAARVRLGRDLSSAQQLEHFLFAETVDLSTRERWVNGLGRAPLKGISELAVAEMLDPASYNNELARVAWFGSRLKKISPHRIWPLWERTWRGRYVAVFDILERWCSVAESHVIYRQRSKMSY